MSTQLTRRLISTTAAALTAGTAYYAYQPPKKMLPTYEATFSVPLECDACVKDISSALEKLPGIHSTTFSIPTSLLTTTSTAPPSSIIRTIQSTGRPAILRGSGAANSAAVCILETPPPRTPPTDPQPSPVRGLIRLIQLSSPSQPHSSNANEASTNGASTTSANPLTLLDLTLTGLAPGRYTATLRASGDISRGPASMGSIFAGLDGAKEGKLGSIHVGSDRRGEMVGEIQWGVWEVVGRGVVVAREEGDGEMRNGDTEGGKEVGGEGNRVVVGVVARSAGVWENEKIVCGCSGKTVWEERGEAVRRGIL